MKIKKNCKKPRVVILTPVFNEEASLNLYYEKVKELLVDHPDYNFTVLFIEDGSIDKSWDVIQHICRRNDRFKAIRLSRNFGSHVALSAGFANAKGDAIVTLACDLQDPPGTILQFVEKWQNGAKIVWGKRKSRDDTTWKVITSKFFEYLLRRFALPSGSRFTTGSFFLADKKVARCFRQFSEQNRITFALVAWTGFEQEVVHYHRVQRKTGESGWSFTKMIKAMYDAFIGFSFLPIRIMTILGLTVSALTFFLGVYLFALWCIGRPLQGWTSTMFAITFFFGIQFLLMGTVGEYLYRIYSEVVRRPLYFVSDQCGVDEE